MVTMTFVERDNNGEVRREINIPKYSEYTFSDPVNIPDDYQFVCWKIDEDEQYCQGQTFDAKEIELTAVYAPLIETTYISEGGVLRSVKAAALPESAHSLNGGWYVVDRNINATMPLLIGGDVHLILQDGKTYKYTGYYEYAVSNLPVKKEAYLTIYGQSEQTGVFNTGNRLAQYLNFTQYGGIVKSDSYVFVHTSANIHRGTFDVKHFEPRGTYLKQLTSYITGGNVDVESFDLDQDLFLDWTAPEDRIRFGSSSYLSGNEIVIVRQGKGVLDE